MKGTSTRNPKAGEHPHQGEDCPLINPSHYTYSAPCPADRPALFTLLQAVGDLREVGRYGAEGEHKAAWNTDAESLRLLRNHVDDARKAIQGGISGIGELLWTAGANEKWEVSQGALRDVGLLLHELAEALHPLDDLDYRFRDGRPAPKGWRADGLDRNPVEQA